MERPPAECRRRQIFRDPVLVLEDHTIILAATVAVKQTDAIVSLHFTPRLEGAKLNLGLERVTVGTFPVPKSYFAGQVNTLTDSMDQKLPALREASHIPARLGGNRRHEAAMGELLVNALKRQPAEPRALSSRAARRQFSAIFPAQIIGINIADKILTLTVQPMNADRREALLQHIRTPQKEKRGN